MIKEGTVIVRIYALEDKAMECLTGPDNAWITHIRLYPFNKA
jgi:hypothetical protein